MLHVPLYTRTSTFMDNAHIYHIRSPVSFPGQYLVFIGTEIQETPSTSFLQSKYENLLGYAPIKR
jgi:hypothetical protein